MREIASAGVIVYRVNNDEIEYLLLHHIVGHWDFAKGKIEPGETKEQAALRELHEEAGLRTNLEEGFQDSVEYKFMERDGVMTKKTVYFFIGRVNDESVILSHEHKNHIWLRYEDAYEKMTFDTARAVLERAHAFIRAHDARWS
jgi:8-oxo-dGTP pyrophosphatase MutT (NUDIX family)